MRRYAVAFLVLPRASVFYATRSNEFCSYLLIHSTSVVHFHISNNFSVHAVLLKWIIGLCILLLFSLLLYGRHCCCCCCYTLQSTFGQLNKKRMFCILVNQNVLYVKMRENVLCNLSRFAELMLFYPYRCHTEGKKHRNWDFLLTFLFICVFFLQSDRCMSRVCIYKMRWMVVYTVKNTHEWQSNTLQ